MSPDRACLTGIIFVLKTGIPWELLHLMLHADKAYDYPISRHRLRRRSIVPRFARRGIEFSARLGRHRRVVESTPALLHRFRRFIIRYERRADLHRAFLSLGCALICWNYVQARLC